MIMSNEFLSMMFMTFSNILSGDKDTIELLELQKTMADSMWAIGGYYE